MARSRLFPQLALFGLLILALAGVVGAEPGEATDPAARRYRILMLLWRGETEVEAGFKAYIQEHNLPFDLIIRNADQNSANIPALVAEARQLKPDLVYTWGTPLTLGVIGPYDQADPARYLTDLPVVFTMVAYPLESRIVPQLASSGRNVTGTTHTIPAESQIKAIRAYRPMNRLAAIYNPTEPNAVINIGELRKAAHRLNFELLAQPLPLDANGRPDANALPGLLAQLAAREPQFFYLGPDTWVSDHRQTITEEALRHHLPVFTSVDRPIKDSAVLMGLVAPYFHMGRFTAFKAEQILIERRLPQDLPIETLHRFTYIVKLPVARQLDLYPPLAILNYAEVIE
ncbi:MAG: ABC transporter substrate-binding protein [Candidatus Contendobacter sp.]|nr:ABC transporter substrate-binding protein [Candidatus Contendobacter sp.]